jgi:hypothetical protein
MAFLNITLVNPACQTFRFNLFGDIESIVEHKLDYKNTISSKTITTYGENNRVLSVVTYDKNDKVLKREIYKYLSDSKIIEKTTFDKTDLLIRYDRYIEHPRFENRFLGLSQFEITEGHQVRSVSKFEYDTNYNLIKHSHYRFENDTVNGFYYTGIFGDNNQLLIHEEFDLEGKKRSRATITYNSDMELVKNEIVDIYDGVKTSSFEYDENKNMIKQDFTQNNQKTVIEHEYDYVGNLIKTVLNGISYQEIIYKHTYDDMNNWVTKETWERLGGSDLTLTERITREINYKL